MNPSTASLLTACAFMAFICMGLGTGNLYTKQMLSFGSAPPSSLDEALR